MLTERACGRACLGNQPRRICAVVGAAASEQGTRVLYLCPSKVRTCPHAHVHRNRVLEMTSGEVGFADRLGEKTEVTRDGAEADSGLDEEHDRVRFERGQERVELARSL